MASNPYGPQPITLELIRALAKARPPDAPKDIRDRAARLILRHECSGRLSLHVELGRARRKFLADARDVINPSVTLTLGKVKKAAERLRGQHVNGRDFTAERKAELAIPTLAQFIEDPYGPWLVQNRRSGEAERARLESCFLKDFGGLKLDKITQAKLDPWMARRQRDDVSAETIGRDIDSLRAALSRGVKLELIASNPLFGVEKPEVDRHKRVVRALTGTEKQALLKALVARDGKKRAARARANRWREQRGRAPLPPIGLYSDVLTPAVIVSLETGLRRGELFAVDWSRVDLDERTLRVEGATAKTFETRDIPLNEMAYKTLRDWWMQEGQPNAGTVFTVDGARIGNLKHSYHAVLEEAGIERVNGRGERVNWHSLRHSFGSLLGAAGCDPTTLQKLMGHADLTTTTRYLHTDEERKRAAVELLTGRKKRSSSKQ